MTGVVVLVVVALLLVAGYEALARHSPSVQSPLGRWSGLLRADVLRRAAGRLHAARPRTRTPAQEPRRATADDVATVLRSARSVVVVPGYGLAVAGGQHALRSLADRLGAHGADVRYAVHPAAGRIPGHLDAVLDDADVPYAALLPAAEADRQFTVTDVVLVVGASDVVNPASGLDALRVTDAARVVVLARSTGPGFAGAPNAVLLAPTVSVLVGDARESLTAVAAALDAAPARAA